MNDNMNNNCDTGDEHDDIDGARLGVLHAAAHHDQRVRVGVEPAVEEAGGGALGGEVEGDQVRRVVRQLDLKKPRVQPLDTDVDGSCGDADSHFIIIIIIILILVRIFIIKIIEILLVILIVIIFTLMIITIKIFKAIILIL